MLAPLFESHLIAGSINSQRELDEAFIQNPNLAKQYVQTAVYWTDLREWFEKYWPSVHPYLDKDFLTRFKTEAEHTARAWEFHLAVVLLEHGLVLSEKTWTYGPDFCVLSEDGKKIWLEAVTCDLGIIDPVEPPPVLLPGVLHSFGGNIEDTHRPRALRITTAIGSKFEQFKKYLENPSQSGVTYNDYLVIAVNGKPIQHMATPEMLFKRAVFGQGPEVLVKVEGKDKLQSGYYKPTLTIPKIVGTNELHIPANFMELGEFDIINLVIYCGNAISSSWLNGFEVGDDFLFAYHSTPRNHMPDGLFNFGLGIRKDVNTGSISVTKQSIN